MSDSSATYTAFLGALRDVPEKWREPLAKWGITEGAIKRFGIRYYRQLYPKLMSMLEKQIGLPALLQCGLLSKPNGAAAEIMTIGDSEVVGAFDAYQANRIPYIVVPFRRDYRPVYLRAVPLADAETLDDNRLPSHLGTADREPCFFNGDCIAWSDQLILFPRILQAMVAASAGYPALGFTNLGAFDPNWLDELGGKHVRMVLDERYLSDRRLEDIQTQFDLAGLDQPEVLGRRAGQTLLAFLRKHFGKPTLTDEAFEGPPASGGAARGGSEPVYDEIMLDDTALDGESYHSDVTEVSMGGTSPGDEDAYIFRDSGDTDMAPTVAGGTGLETAVATDAATLTMPASPASPALPAHAPQTSAAPFAAAPASATPAPASQVSASRSVPTRADSAVQFIAAIAQSDRRFLVVTRVNTPEGPMIRYRYWTRDGAAWAPDETPGSELKVPLYLATEVAATLPAALLSRRTSDIPSWLEGHLER